MLISQQPNLMSLYFALLAPSVFCSIIVNIIWMASVLLHYKPFFLYLLESFSFSRLFFFFYLYLLTLLHCWFLTALFVCCKSASCEGLLVQFLEVSQTHMAWTVPGTHDVSCSVLNHTDWRHCCHDKHRAGTGSLCWGWHIVDCSIGRKQFQEIPPVRAESVLTENHSLIGSFFFLFTHDRVLQNSPSVTVHPPPSPLLHQLESILVLSSPPVSKYWPVHEQGLRIVAHGQHLLHPVNIDIVVLTWHSYYLPLPQWPDWGESRTME